MVEAIVTNIGIMGKEREGNVIITQIKAAQISIHLSSIIIFICLACVLPTTYLFYF